ncbi:hypothetical protein HU200_000741 [Digitaria exilis]|uniref:Glycosyltransferase n=1 Tax=Digitaria exilis TaxID=1010633 RepID=A0A835FXS2_9POAL|nr:hypothetical protein HU200_000741 [Digitaria exilis]
MADPDPEQSIHVLLLPNPSQGHINPILQFGKRLAAHRGVQCTLAVTRFVLAQTGVTGGGVHVATVSDGCDAGGFDEAGGIVAYTARLEAAGSETVGALLRSEAELGRPVHALRRHGVASAAFFTQPCAVDVAYGHAWAGLLETPVVGEMTPIELPGLPAGLRLGDLPTFLTDQGDDRAYLDLLVNQFSGLDTADHVLVNSFYELQPQESEYMASTWRAKTVGPTVPSAYLDNRLPDDTSYGFHLYTPLTAVTRAWLDAKPACSVVYVSFGSLAKPCLVQMAEMAEGLYNSGKDFLWLEVLAHPAIGCFMTHCGWNSTMEGMGAGVPMVAMPQWSDQTMNAKYIEDVWRVGVRVCPDENGMVRREEVQRCVREVMEGDKSVEYRRNATDWKEKAKSAMSEGGSSDNNIIQFLRKLGLKSA